MALSLLACSGGPADPAEGDAEVQGDAADLDGLGWVSLVAYDPAAFAALTATSEAGWIALHANDPKAAVVAFGDDRLGRARAGLSLAVLYDDLSRVAAVAADHLFTRWQRGGASWPAGGDAPMVAALAAACNGGESARAWAAQVADGPDAPIARAIAEGRPWADVETGGPFGRRLALHRLARASGDPAPLLAALGQPVATARASAAGGSPSSSGSDGFEREFWDPCGYRALARVWLDRTARDLDGDGWRSVAAFARPAAGLAGTFLAPWGTAADLEAELAVVEEGLSERAADLDLSVAALGLLGARSPTMRRLGVGGPPVGTDDDPEAARAEVRMLDAALDAWGKKILDQAPVEGRAVVADLSLLARLRQEWLATRARLALTEDAPREALVYAELARDHAASGIGVANAASIHVIAAEAQLRLGHTREALDLLHVVTEGWPEVIGIEETAGDLAVLEGMGRHGDSKEDP